MSLKVCFTCSSILYDIVMQCHVCLAINATLDRHMLRSFAEGTLDVLLCLHSGASGNTRQGSIGREICISASVNHKH